MRNRVIPPAGVACHASGGQTPSAPYSNEYLEAIDPHSAQTPGKRQLGFILTLALGTPSLPSLLRDLPELMQRLCEHFDARFGLSSLHSSEVAILSHPKEAEVALADWACSLGSPPSSLAAIFRGINAFPWRTNEERVHLLIVDDALAAEEDNGWECDFHALAAKGIRCIVVHLGHAPGIHETFSWCAETTQGRLFRPIAEDRLVKLCWPFLFPERREGDAASSFAIEETLEKKFSFYEMLRVPSDAETKEIEVAYRERVSVCKAMRSNDPTIAQEQLRLVEEAFHVLHDPLRRERYDRRLAASKLEPLARHAIEGLLRGAFEQSIRIFSRMPSEDLIQGLIATAYHLQALGCEEKGLARMAETLLMQGLRIPFAAESLRERMRQDLAVIGFRRRSFPPESDLEGWARELSSKDKSRTLKAIATLRHSPSLTEDGPWAEFSKVASSSLFPELRLAAIDFLAEKRVIDSSDHERLRALYAARSEGEKLACLAALRKRDRLTRFLSFFFWDPSEKVRLKAIALCGKSDVRTSSRELVPLLWSDRPPIRRAAADAILRLEKKRRYFFSRRAKLEELRERFKGQASFSREIALFHENKEERGRLIAEWSSRKSPERYLPYVVKTFEEKQLGTKEPVSLFLSAHGQGAVGVLQDAIHSKDLAIRQQAIRILERLQPPEAVGALAAALDDQREAIVLEAARALKSFGYRHAVHALDWKQKQRREPSIQELSLASGGALAAPRREKS